MVYVNDATVVTTIDPEPEILISLEMSETMAYQTDSSAELVDYSQYLKKIWVVSEWDGWEEAYSYPISFMLTKIEDGIVEGIYATGGVVYPHAFRYSTHPRQIGIHGTVNNSVAECQFSNEWGYSGTVILQFINNEIIAVIGNVEEELRQVEENNKDIYKNNTTCEENREHSGSFILKDISYVFKPYNLTFFNGYLYTRSFGIELDIWGEIRLATIAFIENERLITYAFLVNESNDIFYDLGWVLQNGLEILDVVIADMNGDGLRDILLITTFDIELQWVFFQLEDGEFLGVCEEL